MKFHNLSIISTNTISLWVIFVTACPKDAILFNNLCPNYDNIGLSPCISASKLCNGYNDCGDNSDENPTICK